MIKRLWLIGLALIVVACQSPTPLPTALVIPATFTRAPATPTRSATPAPTLASEAVSEATPTAAPPFDLAITAPDGAKLAASFYPPASAAPAPGVLLLHVLGRNRHDWDSLAKDLQSRGYAVLALDLRGHGDSAGPADWSKSPADVRAAWDVLAARPEVDPALCAIVGASIGANLALIVGANNPDVVTVVALSPGVDYHNLKPSGVLTNFGERPIFLVASQDDAYSYDSVKQMAALAPRAETHYFAAAGHGTDMFEDPQLKTLLLDWLGQHIGALKG
jgi:pimeloyl-ACP methyl ester carboxylesterase